MAISQNFPDEGPSLNLNFANSRTLDSRITFTRSSTGTYMNENGLITLAAADSPRFDHSYDENNVESLGLLIEESRTNIQSYSIPNSSNWTTFGATLTENNAISPDGTLTATLFTGTTDNAHFIYRDQTISSSTTYTQSYFVKAGTTNYVQIAPSTGFDSSYQNFDLGNGVLGNGDISTYGGTASITAYPNGWYRISVTMTSTSGGSGRRMVLASITSATDLRLDSAENKTFYVWGAQLEAGSFPTSYIPTTSASVTRSADLASITGTNFSSWFNPSEGTINITYKMGLKTSSTRVFQINNSSTTFQNVIDIVSGSGTGQGGYFFVNTNSVNQGNSVAVNNTGNENTIFKVAGAYKENDLSGGSNKTTQFFTDDVATLPTGLDRVVFSQWDFGSLLCGHLQQVSYYPKRLSNDQLQNLTK